MALAIGTWNSGGDDALPHLGLQPSEHLNTRERVTRLWQANLHGPTPPPVMDHNSLTGRT
ncbi:hypothetical protein Misp05_35570 [Micromonospora sp. NBRC 107095]|nr:hypothetical protein Misp05_35570 [Micromonospora sp. NBRC 107095]